MDHDMNDAQGFHHPDVICSAVIQSRRGKESKFLRHRVLNGDGTGKTSLPADIWCLHCCAPFETTAVVEDAGVFCGLPCWKAHLSEHTDWKSQEQLANVCLIAKNKYGHTGPIFQSAPRSSLVMFGGPYTVQELRSKAGKIEIVTHKSPGITLCMLYEELSPEYACPEPVASSSGNSGRMSGLRNSVSGTGSRCSTDGFQQLPPMFSEIVHSGVLDSPVECPESPSLSVKPKISKTPSKGPGAIMNFMRKKPSSESRKKA